MRTHALWYAIALAVCLVAPAQAQEESLARGSALYPCLLAAGEFHRMLRLLTRSGTRVE